MGDFRVNFGSKQFGEALSVLLVYSMYNVLTRFIIMQSFITHVHDSGCRTSLSTQYSTYLPFTSLYLDIYVLFSLVYNMARGVNFFNIVLSPNFYV